MLICSVKWKNSGVVKTPEFMDDCKVSDYASGEEGAWATVFASAIGFDFASIGAAGGDDGIGLIHEKLAGFVVAMNLGQFSKADTKGVFGFWIGLRCVHIQTVALTDLKWKLFFEYIVFKVI